MSNEEAIGKKFFIDEEGNTIDVTEQEKEVYQAELGKWEGVLERNFKTYSGEVSDMSLVPKHLLEDLAKKFSFVKEYIKREKQGKKNALNKFSRGNIFDLIKEEIDKKHIGDDNLKMILFLVMVSGLLKTPKLRMSMSITAESSEGKDNIIKSTLEHIPSEAFLFVTSATQSTIEDDTKEFPILAFSEINANREMGANKNLIEVIKQRTEGGTSSIKKDIRDGMKSARHEIGEQGVVIYGTTETEINNEMGTRFINGGIKSNQARIKKVNDNTMDTFSHADRMLKSLEKADSWIRIGLTEIWEKSKIEAIIIPYAKFLKDEIDGKYIFDYSNARSQRDIKRIFALTSALTFIHQIQRETLEYEGKKVLISEPKDFIKVLEVSQEFFNQSYTGLDSRLSEVLGVMDKILKKTSSPWVARDEIEKEIGKSRNTIKNYCAKLSGEGLIEGCKGDRMSVPANFHPNKIYYKKCDVANRNILVKSELGKLRTHLEKMIKQEEDLLTPLENRHNSVDKKR